MRKHIREMFRYEAKKRNLKPSRFVNVAWNTYQIKKWGGQKFANKKRDGYFFRALNQFRGSRKNVRTPAPQLV